MIRGKRTNTIVLADAHLLFRRGLRSLLASETDLEVIGEATDLLEALDKARLLAPDVLVMDLGLITPGDGPAASVAIRQTDPATGILFITDEDGPEQLELAVASGARGYMLKNSSPAHLVAGIRQIATLEDHTQGLSRLIPDLQALARSNDAPRASALTVREQEVMRLLAEGRTVREVAAELALSVKTIEAHKLNLMRKLDIHNRTSLIECALRMGLVGEPEAVRVA